MYDSTDGLKAGILKDINTTANDSMTTANVKDWIYIKAPELKQLIIIYSPRYSPRYRPLLGE